MEVKLNTDIETVVTDIVKDLLQVNEVNLDTNLSDYGFSSLSMALLVSQVKKRLRYQLTVRDIFENPTIRMISASIKGSH